MTKSGSLQEEQPAAPESPLPRQNHRCRRPLPRCYSSNPNTKNAGRNYYDTPEPINPKTTWYGSCPVAVCSSWNSWLL